MGGKIFKNLQSGGPPAMWCQIVGAYINGPWFAGRPVVDPNPPTPTTKHISILNSS